MKITIRDDYITLGQFLKFINLINNGGEAKFFLETNKIYVDDQIEIRRGRKIKPGMVVKYRKEIFEVEKNDS